MEAIILVGGLGSRLGELTKKDPKPMLPIRGVPFLDRLLQYLKAKGVSRVILAVGYKYEKIEGYFQCNIGNWPDVSFSIESSPLGTGGAIAKAIRLTTESDVFVINGDSFLELDYAEALKTHKKTEADITVVSCSVSPADRYGVIKSDDSGKIIQFLEKGSVSKGVINGGIYILSRDKMILLLDNLSEKSFSFEFEVLEKQAAELEKYHFQSTGLFLDIGIPSDYYKAQELLF